MIVHWNHLSESIACLNILTQLRQKPSGNDYYQACSNFYNSSSENNAPKTQSLEFIRVEDSIESANKEHAQKHEEMMKLLDTYN